MSIEAHECLQHGFVLGRTLGEGGFAKVKEASYANFTDPSDSFSNKLRALGHRNKVAIKIIKPTNFDKASLFEESLRQEIKAMRAFQGHLNFSSRRNTAYLVLEYCDGGDLLSFDGHNEKDSKAICQALVGAMKVAHDKSIVHRDLKLDNILLDESGKIKISDFGISSFPSSRDHLCDTFCGTMSHMAPEVVRGYNGTCDARYDGQKADVWSLGVILFELVTGCLPYQHTNNPLQFEKQLQRFPKLPYGRKLSSG
ncbi:uncharacterized protein [Clytia hemisphaerica]|uniref:uncharacterized protein n=1 Tax=Clytia hemisphaerica TaxID=252671 RepID=UPI0034D65E8E